jgi:hypothetical protein
MWICSKPLPRLWASVSAVGVFLGCDSGEEQVKVYPVKGSVFADGKPAERAQVIFHPVGEGEQKRQTASAEVAADGSFALNTYTAGDGAAAGDYAVTISWPSGSSPIGGDAESGPDRFGDRYTNRQTSGLKATVKEAPTEIPRFNLKTK